MCSSLQLLPVFQNVPSMPMDEQATNLFQLARQKLCSKLTRKLYIFLRQVFPKPSVPYQFIYVGWNPGAEPNMLSRLQLKIEDFSGCCFLGYSLRVKLLKY